MELAAEFSLASARRLPRLPSSHPCSRLHGHTFGVVLSFSGPIDLEFGWLMDFEAIRALWAPLAAELDHCVLNDVPGLENPTSEALALWIWRRLKPEAKLLSAVSISETGGFRVVYRGD